ncbi:unnamed protein product [Mytilus coruscus]|uniref:Reverse transcriptase Ty1/copia-type domain-containing protein n=1 Tax=Mytilus coruscus TaxID=42192 RepID=A0A6J8C445_MYTCO|nr:unnamed protein product [Mytilus coruscus]
MKNDDIGQNALSTRWVITTKDNQTKARLVVRGFEEEFTMQRDSPTVGKGMIKIFLSITASMNWIVKTTDINVREELLSLGCKQCSSDPAVFVKHTDQRLSGIICCHVDDFLHSGDETFEEVMRKLRTRFVAGKIEEKNFSYVGFQIHQNKNGIILDHSTYMEKIDNTTIEPSRAAMKQDVLNTSEQTLYRKLIGQINWAVQVSRPDMAFEMIDMSTKLKEGTVAHLMRAIKASNRLKEIKSIISFPKMNKDIKEWKIIVLTDASLGNISNGTGSTESHVIWIVDNESNSCPITASKQNQTCVVRSTIAAEALSLQDGHLRLKHQTIPIEAYIDNKSVVEAVYSTKLVDDKRLRIDIAAIAESLASKEVNNIKWCPGDKQLANCMTKFGASSYELLQVIQTGKMLKDFV